MAGKRNSHPMDFAPGDAVSFDADAFSNAVLDHGVKLVHFRGMRCPVGMIDQYEHRRPHEDHAGCQNGLLYVQAGEVTALFTGNSTSTQRADVGLLDGSTVTVTFPKVYDDNGKEVLLATYDRIYLKEGRVPVINWQLFEYNQSGINKMQYPVEAVEHLFDANGVEYFEGADFVVRGGQIHWIGRTPGMNLTNNKGLVCSIRYTYMPFWYVKNLLHEVRVARVENVMGDRHVERMPFQALLQREYIFELEDKDPQAPGQNEGSPAALRQMKAPGNNYYGPR